MFTENTVLKSVLLENERSGARRCYSIFRMVNMLISINLQEVDNKHETSLHIEYESAEIIIITILMMMMLMMMILMIMMMMKAYK